MLINFRTSDSPEIFLYPSLKSCQNFNILNVGYSKLSNNLKDVQMETIKDAFTICISPILYLPCPPNVLHNLLFLISHGYSVVAREIEDNVYAKVWEVGKKGVLWEMCKWWKMTKYDSEYAIFCIFNMLFQPMFLCWRPILSRQLPNYMNQRHLSIKI